MPKDQFVSEYLACDHRRLDLLFESLIRGVQEGKPLEHQQSLFNLFRNGLLRHIHWEEQTLFPIFNQFTGMVNGPTQVMCSEHSQMQYMLDEIVKQQEAGFDVDYLQALGQFLAVHNEKEEKVLYPAIDQLIDTDSKQNIAINISRDFK